MFRHRLLATALILGLVQTAAPAGAETAPKDARLAETPAAAAPTAETQAPAQPWIVNCTNQGSGDKLRCTLTQTIVARETGQRVISAVVFRGEGEALRMTLGLPHGLDLPAGVTLKVDEKPPIATPIRTADQNGSYATIDLTPELIASLKSGTILNVGVTAATGGVVTLQLSLSGFTSAFGRV